jgi:hypothetical protein
MKSLWITFVFENLSLFVFRSFRILRRYVVLYGFIFFAGNFVVAVLVKQGKGGGGCP